MKRMLTVFLLALILSPGLLWAESVEKSSLGSVKTRDGNIAFEVFGAKTAKTSIIVVNGGPGLAHTYLLESGVWQRISKNRRVILYDQRGTGESKISRQDASFTTSDQVADLDALRINLHISRFILVGDSYGGFLGTAYTLAHPEHIAALILSDAPGPFLQKKLTLLPEVFPEVPTVDATSSGRKLTYQELGEEHIRQRLHMYFYSPKKARAYIALSDKFGYVAVVDDAVTKASDSIDFTSQLHEIHAPTLVLNGRFDMNVPALTAWKMATAIPDAQCVFFEQSGHFPAYEESEKYQKVVEKFLERLSL